MAKRNKHKPEASSPTQPVWATAVISIEENKKQKGLELRFNAEPSPLLQSKLRAKEFRHSRQKTMWYGDMTQAARDFADLLKAALPDDPKGPQLALVPSADPVRANLEKKEFSFVMISLADGSVMSYIIFEPSKPKAEVIASNFAQERFKDQFISLAVFPRARLKEARLLFESNLVIDPDKAEEISKEPDPVLKTEDPKAVQHLPNAEIVPPGVLIEKIPLKLIELGIKEGLTSVDYDQGVHFETFAATDDHVKQRLIGWLSDVYFRITWADDEILEGSIDLEPPSFYNDKPAPFSWFVNHYFTFLSKQEPSVLNSQKRIDHAKLMLAHYWLEDKPDRTLVDTAKPGEDPTDASPANRRQLEHQALQKFYTWALQQKDEYSKPSVLTKDQLSTWFKENRPDLDQATVERIWQSHARITKTMNRLTKRDSGKTGSQPYSSIYKKLHKIIPGLVEQIKAGKRHGKSRMDPDGGLMDLNLDFDGFDKDGNPTIALSHYFIQEGDPIADPDMRIRLFPETEMAEAMALQDQFGYKTVYEERDGKIYVNLAEKKSQNKFLNYWLSNLIQQGHKIDRMQDYQKETIENETDNPPTEELEENVLSLLSKFIPGLSQPSNLTRRFESVYTRDAVQQIILASVSPDGADSFNIYFDDSTDQNIQLQADVSLSLTEPRINVKSLWLSPDYIKSYGDKNRDNAMLHVFTRWLNSLVKKGRTMARVIDDTMLLNKESSDEKPSKTERIEPFDALVMAQLIASDGYLDKAWSVKFDREVLKKSSFTADEKDNLLAMYNVYVVPDQHVQDVYNATYRNHHGIHQAATESESTKTISNSRAADLVSGDHQLPNVLVPIGTREPFLTHSWGDDRWEKLKNNFPHLLNLKEEDLPKLTAIEMFELMQFSHPTEFGIDINRGDLQEEWEKRGKDVFEALGYPTDPDYPYVNLHTGYKHVERLDELLHSYNSPSRDKWWAVAENARPIADPSKGLTIIDELIAQREAERATYLNPKTGKAQLRNKVQVGDVDFIIRRLKKSQGVILAYQEAQGPIQTGRSDKDPLATEDGVYTWQSAGEHMETLRIDMPKTAGYAATVYLVKTAAGDYKEGISFGKSFGDYSGASSFPTVQDESYPTRQSALKAALLHHEQELQRLLHIDDSILNNEATKKSKLNQAMKALYQFAIEQGISMEAKPDSTDKNDGIIQGLENAYWTEEDNGYPQNKVSILGSDFHQARLREAVRSKLEKLSLLRLQEIADYLHARFQELRPLESYEKTLVTMGKTGDNRKKILISHYADDIIQNNDLKDRTDYPVMSFLLELLFLGEARLVDVPLKNTAPDSEDTKTVKKQSQHDLNKEIERLIDQKDKEGAYYNEEEKNYLRQYTGSGGLLSEGATGSGTLYEFYTPDALVKKMWDIAYHYGYDGGRVLEPSVGTGNFLKYAPKGAIVFGFETNHYAARIAQILYPNAHIHEKAFETHFFTGNIHLKDKFENPGYSLVIGNPPYGDFTGKYAGLGEKRHTGVVEYDQYFTLRGLDLMKPGGLMVFLVPSYFMLSKHKYNAVKEKIMVKAELIDCYRLPGGSIPHTDVGTDILVWRKRL